MLRPHNLIVIDRDKFTTLLLSMQTPLFVRQVEARETRNKPLIALLDIVLSHHMHIAQLVLQDQGVI